MYMYTCIYIYIYILYICTHRDIVPSDTLLLCRSADPDEDPHQFCKMEPHELEHSPLDLRATVAFWASLYIYIYTYIYIYIYVYIQQYIDTFVTSWVMPHGIGVRLTSVGRQPCTVQLFRLSILERLLIETVVALHKALVAEYGGFQKLGHLFGSPESKDHVIVLSIYGPQTVFAKAAAWNLRFASFAYVRRLYMWVFRCIANGK